jgi:hypothetical protein
VNCCIPAERTIVREAEAGKPFGVASNPLYAPAGEEGGLADTAGGAGALAPNQFANHENAIIKGLNAALNKYHPERAPQIDRPDPNELAQVVRQPFKGGLALRGQRGRDERAIVEQMMACSPAIG